MAWLKIDDGIWSHPKFVGLSDTAHTLWFRGAAWCSQYLTDGFLPDSARNLFGQLTDSVAQELVDAGLWHRVDGGWQYHDWLDWNPSAEATKKQRKADRLRKAKKSGSQQNSEENFRTDSVRNPSGIRPESVRPVPVPNIDSSFTDVKELCATQDVAPQVPKRRTYPEDFETFWKAFPTRKEKAKAYKAWRAALKRAPKEIILDGARLYATWCQAHPTVPIKYPTGWLNGDRWEDDLTVDDTGTAKNDSMTLLAIAGRRLERNTDGSAS